MRVAPLTTSRQCGHAATPQAAGPAACKKAGSRLWGGPKVGRHPSWGAVRATSIGAALAVTAAAAAAAAETCAGRPPCSLGRLTVNFSLTRVPCGIAAAGSELQRRAATAIVALSRLGHWHGELLTPPNSEG
jgi:hypothetical protein